MTGKVVGAVCLIAGITILFFFTKSRFEFGGQKDPASFVESNGSNNTVSESEAEKSNGATQAIGAVDVGSEKGVQEKTSKPIPTQVAFTEEVKTKLISFQSLQNKSVLTEGEEADLLATLKDGDFLLKVGNLLRSRQAIKDPQFESLQSVAIDVIVQALKEGNDQIASDVVWDQIRDPQLEDNSLPLEERKTLAGIKGEILYHATAIRPDLFQDIDMDLPGPASQKIWQNVKGQQMDNLTESQGEVNEYELEQAQKKDDE